MGICARKTATTMVAARWNSARRSRGTDEVEGASVEKQKLACCSHADDAALQGNLQDIVLLEDPLESISVEVLIVGDHVDQASHVGEELALIAVCQQCGHGSIVELNILVVDLDEVNLGVGADQRAHGLLNELRYLALVVIDEYKNSGLPSYSLDGIEVAESIDRVEATEHAKAWACPPAAGVGLGLCLELRSPSLSPLVEELCLLLVELVVTAAGAAPGLSWLGDVAEAEDGAAGGADAVAPLCRAGLLVGAGIGDDTLDTSAVASVEGGGRQVDLGSQGGHPHGCVYLGVAELFVLVEIAVIRVSVSVVWVQSRAGISALGDEILELLLCRSRIVVVGG